MENKTKGRQKIPMKKIEKKQNRYATFSKRRIADAIISRFQNPNMQLSDGTHLVEAHARNTVNQINNRFEELDTIKDAAVAQTNLYNQMTETRQRGWWESIEQLNADQVTQFETWLNATSSNLNDRLMQLENGASFSLASFGM
ncbi:hypothetical protein HAX54_014770 [Datura stramonium]|uniref:MADS-box domain-containing protein n=1 Tax=Datura stramonium TaxID=4076 RepID=A0ABS8TQ89_DATST|nr:hypothetical protein [Datura stramonium]